MAEEITYSPELIFDKAFESMREAADDGRLFGASWIYFGERCGTASPEYRKEVVLKKKARRITAYASAVGVYNLYVNGKKVGNAIMAPGYTSYSRAQYQTYDLTELLAEGGCVSMLAGKGWVKGYFKHDRSKKLTYLNTAAVIALIDIEYEDGERERIVTDESWQVYSSHILDSEIYDGETVDMTAPIKLLGKALLYPDKTPVLVAQRGEKVVERERIAAKELIITPKGERVIDFGQNIAGYAEFRISGKAGERIVVSHAEVLDKYGNFYTDNMRTAKNLNTYVLADGENLFKPSFSFQGFRYIRLDEYPDTEIRLEDICAVAIYSDMRRTGFFECGHEKLNRLYSNTVWSQRSNFIDVPTDCPQRDERRGWTGDAQVFCRTAAINYDVKRFFTKWLEDVMIEQEKDGSIGAFIPRGVCGRGLISAAWGDAGTVCPMELYRAYGDEELLRTHYDMMRGWVDYMHGFGEEEFLFLGGSHYCDWLALDAGGGQYRGATQSDLIATAFFAYSTELLIKAGEILGEDTSVYRELYKNVRAAFRRAFMKDGLPVIYPKADGLTTNRPVLSPTQTAIVLILKFGLCEDSERRALTDKLVELIDKNQGRMTTGFVGTPYILHALSENGRADVAYKLLLSEKAPSWLFSVNMGATTIWEHWDGMNEEGEFWSTDMNSFNHYSYGAVFDWVFGVMMGISVAHGGEGYREIDYAPIACERIGHARAEIDAPTGRIVSSWRYTDDEIVYELQLPCGVSANVNIGGVAKERVCGGRHVYITKR